MFLHLKTKHPGYFQQQTTKRWLQEGQHGKPLKIFWDIKNDFDETETIVLLGCLSTGKTFNYESKAINHFQKNPAALKEHNMLVSEMIKARDGDLAVQRQIAKVKDYIPPPEKSEYLEMKKSNHPELCSALLDVINNHLEVCSKLEKDVRDNLSMTSKVFNANAAGTKKVHTIQELLELLGHWRLVILQKPNDYVALSNALGFLWHFLQIRKFFNGHLAPELDYPWFCTPDHPKGELSYGISRFAKYIWPWETPMNPIDNSTCWIEV